jgi:hypothetical protein
MNKASFYASKPAACSSPIVQMIEGKLFRVHDGHRLGAGLMVAPSRYPADLETVSILEQDNARNNTEDNILGKLGE